MYNARVAVAPPIELAPSTLRSAATARRIRLCERLSTAGIDALLVTNERDIRYLTATPGHDAYLLLTPKTTTLITDPRFEAYLQPWSGEPGLSLITGVRHRLADSLAPLVKDLSLRRVGIQGEHLTLSTCNRLAAAMGETHLVPTHGLVSAMRRIKDEVEIECIRRAIRVQHEALASLLAEISPGMPELEAVGRLEFHMRRLGGQGTSFPTMLLSGPSAGLVHGVSTLSPIQTDHLLLVDSGCLLHGYCCDVTRTITIGDPPDEMVEIFDIVLEAQAEAIKACRPGVRCEDVDRAARAVIEGAGFGDAFLHGVGHGIGLEIHEDPFVSATSSSGILEPGMVITIEPGIYLPGKGGARVEDDVLITPTGHDVLTSYPHDLCTAPIPAPPKRINA